MQTSTTSSILRACLNQTHVAATTYAASSTCGGSSTASILKLFETSACVPQAGGGGGSSATACVTSTTPYIPPASEPNYAYLFGPGGCTGGTPAYISSAAASLPACAAVAGPFAAPAAPWQSVAYTTTCTTINTADTAGFTFYAASTDCTGAVTAGAAPAPDGTCLQVQTSPAALFWQAKGSGCAAAAAGGSGSGGASGASAALSGGAIAGIVVGVLIAAAVVIAALVVTGVVGGGGGAAAAIFSQQRRSKGGSGVAAVSVANPSTGGGGVNM